MYPACIEVPVDREEDREIWYLECRMDIMVSYKHHDHYP
jgi:hypothetical protein